MKFNKLKLLITILLIISFSNSLLAKEEIKEYSVFAKLPLIGEVKVQNIKTNLSISKNIFEYSYNVTPTKIIDFFDEKISSGNISGIIDGDSLKTNSYFFKTEKEGFQRTIQFTYKDGIIDKVLIDPEYDISKITKVEKRMIDNSIDPVTMFFMITDFNTIKDCDRIIRVYDGKRIYDLIISEPIRDKNVFRCKLTHQKVAGYKPEKIAEDKKYVSDLKFLINENLSYEFSEVSLRNNDMDLVIRRNN